MPVQRLGWPSEIRRGGAIQPGMFRFLFGVRALAKLAFRGEGEDAMRGCKPAEVRCLRAIGEKDEFGGGQRGGGCEMMETMHD